MTIFVDAHKLIDKEQVVVYLKGQPAPRVRFIWAMNCYYCGRQYNCYRFPRLDRHHQCSKKCTDKARNRSKRRANVITVGEG